MLKSLTPSLSSYFGEEVYPLSISFEGSKYMKINVPWVKFPNFQKARCLWARVAPKHALPYSDLLSGRQVLGCAMCFTEGIWELKRMSLPSVSSYLEEESGNSVGC